MEPKIDRTHQSSSSFHFEIFSTKYQETNYNRYNVAIEIFESRYLDVKLFKEWNFVEAFTVGGFRNFIFEVPQEIFPHFLRLF